MIGKIYGRLTVIGYAGATQMAKVKCECGAVETHRRHILERGRVRICQECRERKRYFESIKTDAQRLATLNPEIAARVLSAFARHLEMCKAYKTAPTRLATFITEALADPNFDEEMDPSFEARLQRSNPQTYRQYQRPAELI